MLISFQSPSILLSILLLFFLTSQVLAATPTSFCKCINTKTKKSMIIPLDQPTGQRSRKRSLPPRISKVDIRDDEDDDDTFPPETTPYKPKTCSHCTKSFCLDLGLPDFKDADEEDVKTDCFQRDSAKDQAVVFIFITATVSLLGWALGKPIVEKYMGRARDRRRYIPVGDNGNGSGVDR